jgi:hypothetical protein
MTRDKVSLLCGTLLPTIGFSSTRHKEVRLDRTSHKVIVCVVEVEVEVWTIRSLSMSGDRGRKGGEADDVGLGLTDWVIRHASRSLASIAVLSMTSVICEPIRLICWNS